MEFKGQVVLVTGAGRGIGKAIASKFIEEGASVCINDVIAEEAEKTSEELRSMGGEAYAIQADISKEEDVGKMFDFLFAKFGTIDILVNNAGVGHALMVEDMPYEIWKKAIDIHLNGAFLCSKAALPVMQKKKYGKIVNIASVAAKKISYHGGAHYTASKAGLLGFTRHLAYELAHYGINVNAVCPGATLTPLLKSHSSPAELDAELGRFPLGKFCEPEDIADAVLFLCSKKSKMITGQAIDVDGGELLSWMDFTSYQAFRKDYAKKFFAKDR
ncbi:MAG: SDR family oxidoreductase [Desulfobacterales bacterium]|nr:SDR family oxidoreductase [Desulfobacterales bacterium]